MQTRAIGRDGKLPISACKSVTAAGPRTTLEHDEFEAWFINSSEGIEQGWTVNERPSGSSPLVIQVQLGNGFRLRLNSGETAGVLVDPSGEQRLRYRGLTAFDATGKTLAAQITLSKGGFQIRVDDRDAQYPLLVDPLITNAVWTFQGNLANATAGEAVANGGDINGDGFDDVVVGAPGFLPGDQQTGSIFVFYGSPAGIPTSPDLRIDSTQIHSRFGVAVAFAGDVNGDGFDDVLVGASSYDNGESDEGRAFLYLGASTGLQSSPAWTAEPNQAGAAFGFTLASAGDVNADGFDDVIIGAPGHDDAAMPDVGLAFIYHGSAVGLSNTPDWTRAANKDFANFSLGLCGAGDINGDGFDDVVIGAPGYTSVQFPGIPGRVWVYLGSPTGTQSTPDWVMAGPQGFAMYGKAVSIAGDVNGDGFDDVLISAPFFDQDPTDFNNGRGRVFMYEGSASGLGSTPAWQMDPPDAQFYFGGFGEALSCAGDVNGDSFADIVIGYPSFSAGFLFQGAAYLYEGSAYGLALTHAWSARGNMNDAAFGEAIGGGGDVNGDGLDDAVVGAPDFTNPIPQEGAAFLFYGTPPAATGNVINGRGTNPLCLASLPPVLGSDWTPTITAASLPGATTGLLLVMARPSSGIFLSGGEVLVDLSSATYLSLQEPLNAGSASFVVAVPPTPSLSGLPGTAQGVLLGAGFKLCNGFTFTVGF